MAELEEVKERLNRARRLLVLTGAGISAESGVPTFRGGGGAAVWRGMPFEELSSARMVRENLPLVWEWFDYRRGVLQECQPNPAHLALAEWQRSGRFEEFTLVTQNIDGLHGAAGSTDVIELHGNIRRGCCLSCGRVFNLENITSQRPPVCPDCNGSLRPDVVLFGEMLPTGAFERAASRAEACDVCLVVGTSALVYPAASLPAIARSAKAILIEVNAEVTGLSADCDFSLLGKAGEILPRL